MSEERKKRLQQLALESNQRYKQAQMHSKLIEIIPWELFSFISPSESKLFRKKIEGWPDKKWERKLYLQTLVTISKPVTEVLKRFVEMTSGDLAYFISYNYDFGLIEISKELLVDVWTDLIEIDGDQIYCYLPNSTEFICIEKTEEFIVGKEQDGRYWIYEITFSNENLKSKLVTSYS